MIWWDQLQTWIRWHIPFIQGYLTYGDPPKTDGFLNPCKQWSVIWRLSKLNPPCRAIILPKTRVEHWGMFSKDSGIPPENDSSHVFCLFSSFFGPWEKRIFNITRSTKHPEGYQHLETPERAACGDPNKKTPRNDEVFFKERSDQGGFFGNCWSFLFCLKFVSWQIPLRGCQSIAFNFLGHTHIRGWFWLPKKLVFVLRSTNSPTTFVRLRQAWTKVSVV